MLRLLALAAIALTTLGASIATSHAGNEAALANVKTIGVISALGDKLHHVYVGSTAFTNERSGEDIADWKLDEFVIAEFSSLLANRYDVRPVVYDRADFYPRITDFPVGAELDIEAQIRRVKPSDGSAQYDAYVVISNIMNGDFVSQTNQNLFGPDLYRWHGLFGDNRDAIFASCGVALIDGRTGKEIDSIVLLIPGSGGLIFSNRMPAHRIVKDMWGEKFAMPPERREQVKSEMKAILREGATMSVRRLDLVPKE